MLKNSLIVCATACVLLFPSIQSRAADLALRHLENGPDESAATLRVMADAPLPYHIPPLITGKFAEHLGENIYNGMSAQILRNPTLADYPFNSGEMNPDGVVRFQSDRDRIARALRQTATRWGWPEPELDGLAAFWTKEGSQPEVGSSPDTGPYGGRAQRVEVKGTGQGIAQWTYLPLHRVRKLEFELLVRSPNLSNLLVSLTPSGAGKPIVSIPVRGLSQEWQKLTGELEVDPAAPSDAVYKLAVTVNAPGQFVIQHIFLQPADNVNGADPDIVRLLRASHLRCCGGPAAISSAATTGRMASALSSNGQPNPILPGAEWSQICSAPMNSWNSARLWAANR